ncbi:MAG: redoxin domain-containing protein [Deltaproteobacteria bacterium]|nr:redoxin domain-containing protein [Deltaproteobacteria bacterium]
MKAILIGLVVVALAGAAYVYQTRPQPLPQIQFPVGDGETISLDDVRGESQYLVLILVLHGCPLSKASLDMATDLAEEYKGLVTFAGLLMRGGQARADKIQEEEQLPFDLYSYSDMMAADLFTTRDFRETIAGNTIYGGSVIIIDDENNFLEMLEREDVRGFPEKVAGLLGK